MHKMLTLLDPFRTVSRLPGTVIDVASYGLLLNGYRYLLS